LHKEHDGFVWAIKRRELRSFCGIYKVFSIPLRPGKKRRGGTIGPQQAQRSDRKKGKQDKIE
jgi:hypothetical protein